MGITQQSLNRLSPYLQSGVKMLELGAQNLYDNKHYNWIAKDYFELLGIEHISIDIIEHQKCIYTDLREPFDLGEFDIVTNFGTCEHIDGSLYIPFKNIHNACKPGGIMIHENPATGHWPGHGQHYFTMGFYTAIAKTCGYVIEDLCEEFAMGNTLDGKNICCVLRKGDNDFITEEQFNEVYKQHIKSK